MTLASSEVGDSCMSERAKLIVLLYAITVIAALEAVALWKGIDGVALSAAIAAIALLAPSPIKFLRVGNIKVEKLGKGNEEAGDRNEG
jgi:hypothetical protein